MTDGGADYCFECIGLAALMNDAFRSSREVHTFVVPDYFTRIDHRFWMSTWFLFRVGARRSFLEWKCTVPLSPYLLWRSSTGNLWSDPCLEGWNLSRTFPSSLTSTWTRSASDILTRVSVSYHSGLGLYAWISEILIHQQSCGLLLQELELDKFITHEVGFKDINKAFDLLQQGKSLRCTIWMDK